MEKSFQEKTNTVFRTWDPWEDCYGYSVDEDTPVFKKSVEKVQKYLDECTSFKIGGTGCDVKIVRSESRNGVPMFQVKRCDSDFVYCEKKTLNDIAKYLWVDGVVGPCAHIIW